jgi:hypothetical protein
MAIIHKTLWILAGVLLVLSPDSIFGQPDAAQRAVELAQRQITAYLTKLADVHCTESVTQEKIGNSGHVEATERAKYDYLIMMNGTGDDFQLNESRVSASSESGKQTRLPMLVTNGVSTLLLVFHPYYRDAFKFEAGREELVNGRPAVSVSFTHLSGRRTPAALAVRGREYPLELQGTAWLDKQSGEILKVDASLLHDMNDVGLRSLNIHVEYKAAKLGKDQRAVTLPELAVVDVNTSRQHWRNTHAFADYRGFSTETEQDPNVKIRAEMPEPAVTPTANGASASPKEKP